VIDTTEPTVTVDTLTSNDTTPQLTGTIDEPTATVLVTVNGTTYSATNNGDGTWTLPGDTLQSPLAEGTYDIVVVATDAAGNEGSVSIPDALVVDTTSPVVTVDSLNSSDRTPRLTGTVNDPTASIEVTINGVTYSATNNGDGTWALPNNAITDPLPDGTYDVVVTATDPGSNVGNVTLPQALTIDRSSSSLPTWFWILILAGAILAGGWAFVVSAIR
jgi:hypothetical protein